MSAMMELAVRGPAYVYANSYQEDYNAFMKSTQSDRDKVSDERDRVDQAFAKVLAAYARVGFVAESGFCEASDSFNAVLKEAMQSCQAKGVNAESSTVSFFKTTYHVHYPTIDITERKMRARQQRQKNRF